MSKVLSLPKQSISVNEARKLLGKDSYHLSDTQVIEIIITLHLIAKRYLQSNGSNKLHGV